MPNRLASERSPYLQQHANNPVDWFPWGEEAFAKAKAENKPIFLSIGYSSCHWCHVMEEESFENAMVAELLNRAFVSIKVDREERPDVDEAYMSFVQLIAGRGGWPLNVFLTPDLQPFFGGTYFPRDDHGKHPGFTSLLVQIGEAWSSQSEELTRGAQEYGKALGEALAQEGPDTLLLFDREFAERAIQNVLAGFDTEHGGFGQAPKFPPHSAFELLLNVAVDERLDQELRQACFGTALFTMQQMAAGGIHDHVGGGFHRYSTDERWFLPHFEKMLYDNALLLKAYAEAAMLVAEGNPDLSSLLRTVAARIAAWTTQEMLAPGGWFYSALDADSEGEEGKFYLWSVQEINDVLGPDAGEFLQLYACETEGNYLDEATQAKTGLNLLASKPGSMGDSALLQKLLHARNLRPRPMRDEKGIVAWNGLMIGALASAGLVTLAERTAFALLTAEHRHGRLPRYLFGDDEPVGDAFLEDYAAFADGLFQLAEAKAHAIYGQTPGSEAGWIPDQWLDQAERLTAEMVEFFWDEETGGFRNTSHRHEVLFGRTKPIFDQPVPSGNALALRSLLNVGDEEKARILVQTMLGWIERAPGATEALLAAALPLLVDQVTPAAPPSQASSRVQVRFTGKEVRADADGRGRFQVVLEVPVGNHVNSNRPLARWMIPTEVKVQPIASRVQYPQEADAWTDTVTVDVEVALPMGESAAEFEVLLAYQECTDSSCYEAKEHRFSGLLLR